MCRGVIGWLEYPFLKWFLPVPMLAAVFPLIYLFFRGSWRTLESEALALRQELAAQDRVDYRPLLTLTLGALILVMQEYYGQLSFFSRKVMPFVARVGHASSDPGFQAVLNNYSELLGRLWWGLTRIGGYVAPYLVWRFAFPRDSLRDLGLRVAGFRQHSWLYAFFVVVMVPILLIVSRQPDFGGYYPIYSLAGRSWLDFLVWEAVYIGQFVALEMFFRGWWIRTTRIFGTGAIFSMIVPYCMIHFGKPYLETCSALIAGVVLGSLSIRTRSIWAGVAVHVTVAILMDVLALEHKGQLPSALTATSGQHVHFPYWRALIWLAWGAAVVVLVLKGVRVWPVARAAWARRRTR
ncbi:MAG: CPBP family intramembrane glutamic endopeptidase [Bacteroidota bacterium]